MATRHAAIPQRPRLCICRRPAKKSEAEEGHSWHRLAPASLDPIHFLVLDCWCSQVLLFLFITLVLQPCWRQEPTRICLQVFPRHKTSRSTCRSAQPTFSNHAISSARIEPEAARILYLFFVPFRPPVAAIPLPIFFRRVPTPGKQGCQK